MNDYPYLKALLERYNKALNTNSKEIRMTTTEIGLILSDITKMSSQVSQINNTNQKILDMMTTFIKMIEEDNSDDSF